MLYDELLTQFTKIGQRVFQDNLTGIYLHGSAAMGCFNPQKSDLDLIVIVKNKIAYSVKMEFMENIIKLNECAPSKGIEMSIVKKEFCSPFVYPTPYELHFSNYHLERFKKDPHYYIETMQGTDEDLAAHFTIIKKYGITLFGEAIKDVFGEVPKINYIDSIWSDIKYARTDISDSPMYITLNLCRVLAYLKENLILSKKDGGEWGRTALPDKYNSLISDMLYNYTSDQNIPADKIAAQDFSEYALSEIAKYIAYK